MANKIFLNQYIKLYWSFINIKKILTIGVYGICITQFICYGYMSQAGTQNETIQKQIQSRHDDFLQYADYVNDCLQKSNNIFTFIDNVNKMTLTRTEACKSPVPTREQYHECIRLTKELISKTKSVKLFTEDLATFCPAFVPKSAKTDIENTITKLERSLLFIGDRGMGRWVVAFEQGEQASYNKTKPIFCHTDALDLSTLVHHQMTMAEMSFIIGDIYDINKYLDQLKIAKDYIITFRQICKASGFKLPENDPGIRKIAEQSIKDLDIDVNEIVAIADATIEKLTPLNFEQLAQKMCKKLKYIKDELRYKTFEKLCENPVNTPEWTYAIHHIWINKDKKIKK